MADTIVVCNQTLYGKYVANILCFSNIQTNPTNFQIFADNFRAGWDANFAGGQHTNWSLDSLTFQVIDATQVLYSVDISFTAGALVGRNAGDSTFTTGSLLVSTSFLGVKPNRGKIYLAGLTETSTANSRWTASILASGEALVQDWVNGVNDGNGDCFLRILRRPSDKFPAYVSNPVTSIIARDIPASQDRRKLQE